jgi:hypothetical protein
MGGTGFQPVKSGILPDFTRAITNWHSNVSRVTNAFSGARLCEPQQRPTFK